MFSSVFHDAKAHIKGGRQYPNVDGYVYFRETKDGVVMTVKMNGLPTSKDKCKGRFFGFHIHDRNILYRKLTR